MNRFVRLLSLLSVTGLCLVACSSDVTDQGGSGQGSASVESTGPAAAAGPMALPAEGGIKGGTYDIDLDEPGSDRYPGMTITVPDTGWESYGFGVGSKNVGIGLWDVDRVFSSQCINKRKVHPGPSIEALVSALEDQQRRVVQEPVAIVQDGVRGVQIALRVPNDVDLSTCDHGYFDSWTGAKDSKNAGCCRWQQGPGQVDRLWIFDVDGTRLVVDANYMPTADAADRQELFEVLDSIRFQPSVP